MSTAMRLYLVAAGAIVILPWLLTELTHALGIGVKR